MTYEALLNKIQSNSKFTIASQKDLPSGKQIKFNNGAIVNWFNTERITYQGKNLDEVKTYIENDAKTPIGNKVFVVYGHDDIAKTQLEAMLRRWELNPIILDQIASEGKTIIEKLEDNSKDVHYAIVLATPDDLGYSKNDENKKKYRVRQNVILELGMFLAKLGRDKVAILLKSYENFEKPSDIDGLIYIPFTNKVDKVTVNLVKELSKQGYHIDPKLY